MKTLLVIGAILLLSLGATTVTADYVDGAGDGNDPGLICYKRSVDLGGGYFVEAEGCVLGG